MSESIHVCFIRAAIRQIYDLRGTVPGCMVVEDVEGSGCCKLHHVVEPADVGVPCQDEAHGTHAAILARERGVSHHCMTEKGCRVLDQRCVAMALGFGVPVLLPTGVRPKWFYEKYFAGFTVVPSVYGQGYCYLHLFDPGARSRAARILGAFPEVVDVLKLWVILGDWSVGVKLTLEKSGCSSYHVRSGSGSDMPVVGVVGLLAGVVTAMPHARIGALVGRRDYVPVPVVDGIFAGNMTMSVACDHGSRVDSFVDWMKARGIDLPKASFGDLSIVIRPYSTFGVDEPKAKDRAKMLAVMGDHVLKLIMSFRCVGSMSTVSKFSSFNVLATNSYLAERFNASGLRDICGVEELAPTSKGNADIVEAIIGVLSMHLSFASLEKFVSILGIKLPDDTADACFEEAGSIKGLTSSQLERAMELANRGELGK